MQRGFAAQKRSCFMAKDKRSTELNQGQKKNWFKRFLERVAKANEKSGGQVCTA
jgi:hypothetical protein